MRRSLTVLALAILAVLGSCRDQDITSPDLTRPQFAILDAAHGDGNPDFFFLPPLVPNPVNDPKFEKDEFNPNLQPHIEVCKLGLVEGEEVCVGGKIVLTTDGDLTLPATLVPDEEHYKAEWDTGVSGLEAGKIYRVFAFVGSTPLGFLDVTPRTGGMKNATTDDEFLFQDGRTLPVRFRIESGALCAPPGTKPCASSTIDLEEGGEVVLEDTGDRVDIPVQDGPLPDGGTEVTVTIQLCNEDPINVDLPTFGNCLRITSDPELTELNFEEWGGLSPRAVVSMCSLIDAGLLPPKPQRDLVTLHRERDDGVVQALPHAEGFCETPEPESASLFLGGFRNLASRGMDLLREGLVRLGAPGTLHARARALRLDVGHAGESPFLSKFQFALPAEMEIDETTDGQTAGVGGTVSPAPTVIVTDRDGGLVAGATVRFEVVESGGFLSVVEPGGSLSPADVLTVISGADGRASIADAEEGAGTWTLGKELGTYQLRAFGFGIAGSGDDGPFMPVNVDPDTGDPVPTVDQEPVTLAEGEVTFTATAVCESEPCAVGTIDLTQGGSVILEKTGDRIDIPAQDPDSLPDGVTEVTITLELCDGIDVDLPTFGNCLRITSDPELTEDTFQEWSGLSPRAIVSMCSVELDEDAALALGALAEAQRDLVTLHRERDNGVIQALPHADDECPSNNNNESVWSGENASLAQRGLSVLRRGVTRLAGAKPLLASGRRLRLDVGHAGESPFLSNFQLALPAQMEIVKGTTGFQVPVNTAVPFPPAVLVTDRNGDAVAGATVHFRVTLGGGSVEPAEAVSGENGIAAVEEWVVGGQVGPNELEASGRGIATPADEGPFMPDLEESTGNQQPVEVGTGHLIFFAEAIEDDDVGLWSAVDGGVFHTCGITLDGAAHCWGQNVFGQLGNGTTFDRSVPTPVANESMFLEVSGWGNVADGENDMAHTCGVTADGEIFCWGRNVEGQLGAATTETCLVGESSVACSTEPIRVTDPSGGPVSYTAVSSGIFHSCGLASNGNLFCWGRNLSGQLGDGTTTSSITPVLVQAPNEVAFTAVSAGGSYTCALGDDEKVYCWGANSEGQLGDGSRENRSVPGPVAGDAGELAFRTVSAGDRHACAVTSGGEPFCWGNNAAGQLGDGTEETKDSPVAVAGNLSVSNISAATLHTCALTLNGQIFCWGFNASGQLGTGGPFPSLVPVEVADPDDGAVSWTHVSAGRDHSCGITTSGHAYCWGRNHVGQLGDGTNEWTQIPVRVAAHEAIPIID